MKTSFTFKHLKPSQKVENYAEQRLGKLEKFALKPLQIKFIFEEHRHLQSAEAVVTGYHGRHTAVARGENLFAAIDEVVDKLERQLSRQKEKVQSHKKKLYRSQKLQLLLADTPEVHRYEERSRRRNVA